MSTYTVTRLFRVEVLRSVEAKSFAEAAEKMKALDLDKFMKVAPGAELLGWDDLPGALISEERE